ncbi:hypothetical protein [Nocardia wallacei]|uniref:TPR repeat region-containing protein n=1 Tax=Nocardia wallacei TaxID=480035 RepID=UPI0024568B40|nr:hypothetical protein [Nocardia wallacei]
MAAATKSQAEQCDPNALDTLIKEWQTAHDTITTSLDKAGNDYNQSQSYWTGKTGDRARETTQQAVTAGRTFTGELQTAITTVSGDRDAIWRAKTSATQSITNAINAKYDVAEDGTVEPSEGAKIAAQSSSEDKNDQTAALAALRKYGKDTLEPPIKTALNELGTAVETAGTHIQNAFQNSGGLTTVAVEAPGKLDPTKQLTAEQGKEDGETIADGKLSDEERQRILDHLKATGLTPEQLTALQNGGDVTIPQSSMDYLTNLYDKSGRDGLLTLSETLKTDKSPQAQDLRTYLANGMMTVSNENLVTRDAQGKIQDRGGFNKLNPEIREFVGTRPNIGGAPDSNTRDLPDDYRGGFLEPKIDNRSGIKDYTADMDKFADFVNGAGERYQPGDRFGVELGRQAAHQAWIVDNGGYGDFEGTKLRDTESEQHTENSATDLLAAASRNKDANYALLTGNGSEELFGKDTPGQSWHPYDRDTTVGTLLTHEWNDDGAALGSMVDWTYEDAHSSDPTRAGHAGQAAGALSELMSTTKAGNGTNIYESLLNMPDQNGESFAKVNPLAAQGIAKGLSPFVADIVGAPASVTGTHGFPSESLGPVEATRLFSVFDGDEKAGATMNGSALAVADQIDRRFADGATGTGPEQVDLGHYSGRLRGVVDAGINASIADLNLNETDSAKAQSDQRAAAYGVGQNLIGMAGMAGPAGGLGGPVVQAVSEYYKNDLTSVDPDLSNKTPSVKVGDNVNLQQSGTIGAQRYNMLAQLVESGQINSGMLPGPVYDTMLTTSPDGSVSVKPYISAADTPETAGILDNSIPGILSDHGISSEGQQNYLNNGNQAQEIYKRIISNGTIDGQQEIKRLSTDELERQGYNQWSTTR